MTYPPGPPPSDPFRPASSFPAAPVYAPPPPTHFQRPGVVTFLAVLDILGGLLYLGLGTLALVLGLSGEIDGPPVLFVIIGGILAAFGALYLATGLGLWILKPFGRGGQLVLSLLWLLSIPFGTIIGAMTIYYLTRPGVGVLFSGKAPALLSPDQRSSVDRDARGGALLVALIVCIGFGGIAMVGILAAVAIPGLLSARMAGNEAVAIGRLRGMASAQAVHATDHSGQFGTLDCLNQPSLCPPPGGEAPSAPYLNAESSASPASGYTFRLSLSDDQSHYTYWAEPQQRGTSGTRAFCLEPSGVVQAYEETIPAPPIPGETCPAGGEPLM